MFRATGLNILHHTRRNAILPNCTRLSLSPHVLSPHVGPNVSISRTFSSSQLSNAVYYVRFGGNPNRGKRPNKVFSRNEIMVISGVGLAAGAYYISHLEQVPETGRWRFMNVKPAAEESIGRISREEILKEYQHHILPPNHILSRHVRRVVTQILTASNLGHIRGESSGLLPHLVQPPFGGEPGDEAAWDPDAQWGKSSDGGSGQPSEREWDVIVVNDPKVVNAMATPEIGHVVARHTAERISSQTVIYSLLGLASFLGLDVGFTQVVQHFLLELPNSRTQELEADKIGLKLMSKACFDPQGAIDMFERMTRLQGSSKIDFFNTHPSGTKRGEELSKLLPEAYDVLNSSPDCAAMQDRLRSFREVAIRGPGVEDF